MEGSQIRAAGPADGCCPACHAPGQGHGRAPRCRELLQPRMGRSDMERAFAAGLPRTALAAGCRLPDKPAGCVRVATYNVHLWQGYWQGTGPGRMLSAAHELDADVLLLQEATAETAREMRKFYPHVQLHLVAGWFGNAICSRFPLEDVECVNYDTEAQGDEPRSYVLATVRPPGGHRPFRVVSTHLDVWDRSGSQRYLQAVKLAQRFGGGETELARDTLILGDMNAMRRSDYGPDHWAWIQAQDELRGVDRTPCTELEPLFSAGWRDAHAFHSPCITTWSLRRVDFVLLHPQCGLPLRQAMVSYNTASDHLPIAVDLELLMP
mmetsp:Transcript_38655/g.98868  ORF Transcript_38655/g.98868 Transcript_38655/m.98868 type:complete len:323 (-) Transcript_38655:143-1111(-)|eukprot:jgi/Tetstr1/421263/TSEL_001136.t1